MAALTGSSLDSPVASQDSTAKYEHMFTYRSMKTFFSRLFVKSITSHEIRSLPTSFMFCIGGIVHVLTLAMLITLFIGSYDSLVSNKILSLQSDAGVCNVVPVAVNGMWLGDQGGNWQGTRDFNYATAMYQFEVNNMYTNQSQFAADLDLSLIHI